MLLPKRNLVQKIECVELKNERRPHLGASQIGHKCSRYLFYHFRWGYERDIEPRLQRIFKLGDHLEEVIIDSLRSIDLDVTNAQDRIIGLLGHYGGSIDGIVIEEGEDKLFEAKSMNAKNFKAFQTKGVETSHPKYYAQVQSYMGYLNLQSTLFCSINKDNCELHIEEVQFNQKAFDRFKRREAEILTSSHPDEFEKIGSSISWYECRYCDARQTCHLEAPPPRTCRSCAHVGIQKGGKWHCEKQDTLLTFRDQENACEHYRCEW